MGGKLYNLVENEVRARPMVALAAIFPILLQVRVSGPSDTDGCVSSQRSSHLCNHGFYSLGCATPIKTIIASCVRGAKAFILLA